MSDQPTGQFDTRALGIDATRGVPAPVISVTVGAATDAGRVRANNEDHFLVARLGRFLDVLATNLPSTDMLPRFEQDGYALAIADGMGGAAAGEVASALALRLGTELALGAPRWHLDLDDDQAEALVQRALRNFREIDRAVRERASREPRLAGMGTTLTVVYTVGQQAFVFHVGDSRAYLFRQGSLRQVTRDHTVAQALADAGAIPADAVQSHARRHVLTQAIGAGRSGVEAAVHEIALEPGDAILLCTDGLTDMVPDGTLCEVLDRYSDAQAAAQALVAAALEAGGRDNVTVVVARYRA